MATSDYRNYAQNGIDVDEETPDEELSYTLAVNESEWSSMAFCRSNGVVMAECSLNPTASNERDGQQYDAIVAESEQVIGQIVSEKGSARMVELGMDTVGASSASSISTDTSESSSRSASAHTMGTQELDADISDEDEDDDLDEKLPVHMMSIEDDDIGEEELTAQRMSLDNDDADNQALSANTLEALVANNSKLLQDEVDRHTFLAIGCPRLLIKQILRIKHRDASITSLKLLLSSTWDEKALERMGEILGYNSTLEELKLNGTNTDVTLLCSGLQYNQCVEKIRFNGINLCNIEQMTSLNPFVTNNTLLKKIDLSFCNIGEASLDILSDALLNRSDDTLESINLSDNNWGDIDLDKLVVALMKCKSLKLLLLKSNGIGQKGCTSLAKLFKNKESNLRHFDVSHNFIEGKGAFLLAESLVGNMTLQTLQMWGRTGITTQGWRYLLRLVCNTDSMNCIVESNHNVLFQLPTKVPRLVGHYHLPTTLCRLDMALGIDDFDLLNSCLKMNKIDDKLRVARRKIIWAHSKGYINVAESSIPTALLPDVMAWFLGYCPDDWSYVNLIKFHEPPLSKYVTNVMRLDSIYRILTARPDLCYYHGWLLCHGVYVRTDCAQLK